MVLLVLHSSIVVVVSLAGVGRKCRGGNDYTCCSVPQILSVVGRVHCYFPRRRIRTMRGPQSVFVAQMRCTWCARVGAN